MLSGCRGENHKNIPQICTLSFFRFPTNHLDSWPIKKQRHRIIGTTGRDIPPKCRWKIKILRKDSETFFNFTNLSFFRAAPNENRLQWSEKGLSYVAAAAVSFVVVPHTQSLIPPPLSFFVITELATCTTSTFTFQEQDGQGYCFRSAVGACSRRSRRVHGESPAIDVVWRSVFLFAPFFVFSFLPCLLFTCTRHEEEARTSYVSGRLCEACCCF